MSKSKYVRPFSLALAAITASAVLLAACGGGQGSTGAGSTGSSGSSGTVTLEYWDWWVAQSPTIDHEIQLFEQQHPNIKIHKTTQVVDKYGELLNLAYKGGNAPDVYLLPDNPKLQDEIKLGWLMPLNKWATTEWQSQFPAGSFAEGSNVFNGQIYTAPYDGNIPWLQLYVNTKVFKDAGIVDASGNPILPKTWADVSADAKKITQSSGGQVYGWGFGDKQKFILPQMLIMAQLSGAPDATGGFDARTGQYTWSTNPVYGDWIKWLMDMKQAGVIIPNAMSMDDEMARAAFADGKFGMMIGGAWLMPGWQETHPNFKDYAVAPVPYEGTAPSSYFYYSPGGKGWGISANTKHPEEAWLWFDWLNSKQAAVRWVQDGQGGRVYPDVNKPEYAKTPQFAQFLQQANLERLGPATNLDHPSMNDVKMQAIMPGIQDIIEGVYTGQITDYQSALKDLELRSNAELARAIKDAQDHGVQVDPSWWAAPNWDLTQNYTPSK